MKNNRCNSCVPYQPVPMLDSRATIPDPVLVGHIWAVQVGSTVHALPSPPVKWRQTQSDPSAMQCQVFRKRGFPQRWSGPSVFPKSLAPHYGRWNLVNCRLSSCTSISVLLNSFSSFRIAALSAGVNLAQGLSARRS